jgi:hypothetical protein
MKISTKNVLLMLYFKFQLEILSSTHDYHKLVLHNPCLNSQDTMCLDPPQSFSFRILVSIILLIRA